MKVLFHVLFVKPHNIIQRQSERDSGITMNDKRSTTNSYSLQVLVFFLMIRSYSHSYYFLVPDSLTRLSLLRFSFFLFSSLSYRFSLCCISIRNNTKYMSMHKTRGIPWSYKKKNEISNKIKWVKRCWIVCNFFCTRFCISKVCNRKKKNSSKINDNNIFFFCFMPGFVALVLIWLMFTPF